MIINVSALRGDDEPTHTWVYPDRIEIYAGRESDHQVGQRPVLDFWLDFFQMLDLRDRLNEAMRKTADYQPQPVHRARLHELIDGPGHQQRASTS